jgi:hypothetical protein
MEYISQILSEVQLVRENIVEKYQPLIGGLDDLELELYREYNPGVHQIAPGAQNDQVMRFLVPRLNEFKNKVKEIRRGAVETKVDELRSVYENYNQMLVAHLSEVSSDISEIVKLRRRYFAKDEEEVKRLIKHFAGRNCFLREYPQRNGSEPESLAQKFEQEGDWDPKQPVSGRFECEESTLGDNTSKYTEIIEAWHWSPLQPSGSLYHSVMGAAGLCSDWGAAEQSQPIRLDSEQLTDMESFLQHFTTLDSRVFHRELRMKRDTLSEMEFIETVKRITSL